ncbi:MAG: DEAD/DEAH box helicase [Candidatus Dormibacteraceae bacterium]
MNSFAELGASARTLAALQRQSIETPVSVQAEAIPPLMEGQDVVMQAPTGSGKTLAFLIPLIRRMDQPGPGPRALIVTPTRELAMQVEKVFRELDSGLKAALLYGGVGYATQTLALKRGADVVIGTPGRTLDMVGRRLVSLSRVEYLVLDEADEMLDAGFAPDVERILGLTYQPQMVLASATMPDWVTRMIGKHMREPVRIEVELDEESLLEHGIVRVDRGQKLHTLSRLLRKHGGSAIVFGRTKHGVRKLNRELKALGHDSVELQGNLSQTARDRTMEAFRHRRTDVLVATNVAARGLDITHVRLVVNYELPETPQWLTHRIGRTARMGEKGRALTFLSPEDLIAWRKLRSQGAPSLPEVDIRGLLEENTWRYLAQPAEPGPASVLSNQVPGNRPRPSSMPGRRRRGGGRGRYRPPPVVREA